MKNWITIFLVGCVFSMYIFPFTFTFLPIGNTKIFIAVLGLVLWGANMIGRRESLVSKSMVKVSLWAFGISLISVISLAYNGATDTAYVSYLISMWVWVGAAYLVCHLIKSVHGRISVELICWYFIGVCAAQCVLAILIEFIPYVKSVIDSMVVQQSQQYIEEVDRMYGIGAAFDTAGSRFACSLIMLTFLFSKRIRRSYDNKVVVLFSVLFIWIGVVGNMIARTTSVGLLIAVLFLLIDTKAVTFNVHKSYAKSLFIIFGVGVVLIPIGLSLFKIPAVENLFRFAFEMLFNLADSGELQTGSTDVLLEMWRHYPRDFKTWIIGDGYFISPIATNPYYVGDHQYAYYMGVDVGYLRFIYYFGLIGLLCFVCYMFVVAKECMNNNPQYKALFIMLLIMNYVLWAKVATDLFCVFALFLMLDPDIQEEKPNTNLTTVE